jgi:uncharacterized protein DUF5655
MKRGVCTAARPQYNVSLMPTISQHFKDRDPLVRAIYDRIVDAAGVYGPLKEEPKKTSIHLVRSTAFAGVATRKNALILTLKSTSDIESPRIVRREQASANRWHVEIRLEDPKQVDAQLKSWLKKSIDLAD